MWLWTATLVVFGLGIFRGIYVATFGGETALHTLRLLNLDGEGTLPAWYSAALMLASAGLLVILALVSRQLSRGTSLYWWALAAVFVYLSMDETLQLHELAQWIPPTINPGGIFSFNWVLVAGPLLIVGGLIFLPFLWRLPRTSARRILVAGFVFVGGAYGMELVGAHIYSTAGINSPAFLAEVIIEEGMEMAGLGLFISALLDLIAHEAPALTIRFAGRETPV